ncbi:MAG: hypothetical protein GVY30_02945 [Chloroflexi bacterium]|jgi:hypothetical protein|nr:hypothetical protein [Chloroflexota bacterium]
MTDPITNRTAQILAGADALLIPISEIYDALKSEGWMGWINEDMFLRLLLSDSRFDVVEGLVGAEILEMVLPNAMLGQRWLSGPRVMLRSRVTSPRAIIVDELDNLAEMNEALEIAWQMHAADDPEIRAELVNLLMMADMLERELKYALMQDTFDPFEAGADFPASSSEAPNNSG